MTTETYFDPADLPDGMGTVHHTEVGWPLRCWWGAERVRGKNADEPLWIADVPHVLRDLVGVGRLPIGIHPLQFITNTLSYAAVPTAIWLGLWKLPHWRRQRAGRCVSCGYDRAGLAAEVVCPECGHL
jgi:hypothetical protein